MTDIENHLEIFLDLKLHFNGEKTIKFFDPVNAPEYQNTLLIHQPTRTILDMKIQDPSIFTKIGENFSKLDDPEVDAKASAEITPSEDTQTKPQSFKLTTNIDLYTFVDKIISPTHKMVGFVTKGYNKSGDDGFVLPGTQMFSYQII